jgi:hypothetical protein
MNMFYFLVAKAIMEDKNGKIKEEACRRKHRESTGKKSVFSIWKYLRKD